MAARIAAQHGRFDLGQNADINVTPFVDIMLVLLIIFMVAAPLATATLKVELPTVDGSTRAPPRPPVFVDVGIGGKVYVQGREVALSALIPSVGSAIGTATPQQERVMLRGDKAAPYQDVVTVMNTLTAGGYNKVGLVGVTN